MLERLWNWFSQTTGIETLLYRILMLLALVSVLVVVVLLIVAWGKFSALPLPAKALVIVAVALVILIIGLIMGWVLEAQIIAWWDSVTAGATNIVLWLDRFGKANPFIGVLLLCIIPVLFLPNLRGDD